MVVGLKKSRSPLLIIFFTVFIDLLGFGIVLPLSPYYAEHFGANPSEVGFLQASYSLMQFLFAPLWGHLSDKYGRRPILLMSIFGGFVSFFIFAFATHLWVLFFARMLQGTFAANLSASQAYIADITTRENRSKGMGLLGAAFGLGFVLGPAIGAQLSVLGPRVGAALNINGTEALGMGFPALFASLLCLSNFTLAYFLLPESLKKEFRDQAQSQRKSRWDFFLNAVKRPELGWLIVLFFISSFAIANMESTLALFSERRLQYGIKQTGELFAFVGLLMAITQGYLIRKILPVLGERKLLVIGPLLSALGLAAIAFVYSTPQMLGAMLLLGVGSGLSNPAIMGGISLVTSESEQGAILGLNHSLGSLARVLGPTCGGLLFLNQGPSAPYFLAGAVMFMAALLALKNNRRLPDVRELKNG